MSMNTNQSNYAFVENQFTKKTVLNIKKQNYRMMCMCWL
ncbi:MAG: hypothetical protein QG594_1414 [Bacteroidota bacterium]|nr:hypothetical protein [Bacteroidota bacterium]